MEKKRKEEVRREGRRGEKRREMGGREGAKGGGGRKGAKARKKILWSEGIRVVAPSHGEGTGRKNYPS